MLELATPNTVLKNPAERTSLKHSSGAPDASGAPDDGKLRFREIPGVASDPSVEPKPNLAKRGNSTEASDNAGKSAVVLTFTVADAEGGVVEIPLQVPQTTAELLKQEGSSNVPTAPVGQLATGGEENEQSVKPDLVGVLVPTFQSAAEENLDSEPDGSFQLLPIRGESLKTNVEVQNQTGLLGSLDQAAHATGSLNPLVSDIPAPLIATEINADLDTPSNKASFIAVDVSEGVEPVFAGINQKTTASTSAAREATTVSPPQVTILGDLRTGQVLHESPDVNLRPGTTTELTTNQIALCRGSVLQDQPSSIPNAGRNLQLATSQADNAGAKQAILTDLGSRPKVTSQVETQGLRLVARAVERQIKTSDIEVDFDPRVIAASTNAGLQSKPGTSTASIAAFQLVSNFTSQTEIWTPDSSTVRDFTTPTSLDPSQTDGFRALFGGDERTQQSTQPSTQNTRPTGFSLALAEQLKAVQLQDGVTKVQLSPRGLGVIEVEVMTDLDNSTNVVIRSDNAVVLSALKEVRELVSQFINMDSGGTLNFEQTKNDDSSQRDNSSQDQGSGFGASPSDATLTGTASVIELIDDNQLDITT